MYKSGGLTQELAKEFGSGELITNPSDVGRYRVCGVVPKALFVPDSGEELAEAIAVAHGSQAKVILGGNWTKSGWGGVPEEPDVAISASRLKRMIDHDPANFTVTIEPGLTIAELNSIIKGAGQFFPLDPPFFLSATLGGVIATNSSGPRRHSYGAARDLVLGLKVVLPDGEIIKTGGKTMKNVVGYDMTKLFVGSWGSLGAIIQATLRTYPMPEEGSVLIFSSPDLHPLTRIVSSILKSYLTPSFIEILDPVASALFSASSGIEASLGGKFTLVIAVEGFAESVKRQVTEIKGYASPGGTEIVEVAQKDRSTKIWETLRDLSQISLAGKKTVLSCRASLPPSQVGDMVLGLKKVDSDLGLRCSIVAHAGSGGVMASFYGSEEEAGDIEKLVTAVEKARSIARLLEGSLVVETSSQQLKSRVDVWGLQGISLRVMRAIKSQLDPQGTLCAGRFVGGI
jgi:glycolate oxidase FAD binding subunit